MAGAPLRYFMSSWKSTRTNRKYGHSHWYGDVREKTKTQSLCGQIYDLVAIYKSPNQTDLEDYILKFCNDVVCLGARLLPGCSCAVWLSLSLFVNGVCAQTRAYKYTGVHRSLCVCLCVTVTLCVCVCVCSLIRKYPTSTWECSMLQYNSNHDAPIIL